MMSKREDDVFLSFLCNYDIVCLVETMQGDSSKSLPDFSPPFAVNAKKRKKRGRKSGAFWYIVNQVSRATFQKLKNQIFHFG